MTLDEYFTQYSIKPTDFAVQIGLPNPKSIYRYLPPRRKTSKRSGEPQIPTRELMAKIVAATENKVTPNDFHGVVCFCAASGGAAMPVFSGDKYLETNKKSNLSTADN